MGTVADKLAALENTKAGIKAAITEKGQSVGEVFADYPAAIRAIQTGPDTSDATATEQDILVGKIAYGASGQLFGLMPKNNLSNPSVLFHSDTGLITAEIRQKAGYTPGGTNTNDYQLETAGEATIIPSAKAQVAVSQGLYTTGTISVAGDANLVPENIKSGVRIFGVDGTFEGGSDPIRIDLLKYRGGYSYTYDFYYYKTTSQAFSKATNTIGVEEGAAGGVAYASVAKNSVVVLSITGTTVPMAAGVSLLINGSYVPPGEAANYYDLFQTGYGSSFKCAFVLYVTEDMTIEPSF